MIIKIMSGENIPDEDTRKLFTLFDNVASVTFERTPSPSVTLSFLDVDHYKRTIPLHGNVYVINEYGEHVSAFGVAEYHTEGDHDEDGMTPEQREQERLLRATVDTAWGCATESKVVPSNGLAIDLIARAYLVSDIPLPQWLQDKVGERHSLLKVARERLSFPNAADVQEAQRENSAGAPIAGNGNGDPGGGV